MGRWWTTGALAALVLPLAACSSAQVSSSTCIDWVWFDTPTDAAADADAVAIGRVTGDVEPTSYMGMTANRWSIDVESWLDGTGPADITVTSLPRSCGDEEDSFERYDDGQDIVLFLRDDAEGWQALTPFQGIAPVGPDGGIPTEWPDESED